MSIYHILSCWFIFDMLQFDYMINYNQSAPEHALFFFIMFSLMSDEDCLSQNLC